MHATVHTAYAKQTRPHTVQRAIPNRETPEAKREKTLCCFPLTRCNRTVETWKRHRHLENPQTQEIAERKADVFLSAFYEEGQRNKVTANVLIDLLKKNDDELTKFSQEICTLYCSCDV